MSIVLGILILAIGSAIPAAALCFLCRPTRDETDDEWMDRIFAAAPPDGDSRRKRVPMFD